MINVTIYMLLFPYWLSKISLSKFPLSRVFQLLSGVVISKFRAITKKFRNA